MLNNMSQQIFQVDAFTNQPYKGNPAGVCLLAEAGDERWMQAVASEMNVSETAFLHSVANSATDFHLRWFTPTVEVDLCGHATLASAHILWEQHVVPPDAVIGFHTRSGRLAAERRGEWIELDFPAKPATQTEAPAELLDALGVEPRSINYIGKNSFDYIVEVASEELLRALQPDMRGLRASAARGVIVTSRAASSEYDFVSRFFAPGSGIDEDPVTGSAHCCLGPHWQQRLGKNQFRAYQASARGGVVRVRIEEERVRLGGQAVTVLRGELLFAS